jgi:hypothetical protein
MADMRRLGATRDYLAPYPLPALAFVRYTFAAKHKIENCICSENVHTIERVIVILLHPPPVPKSSRISITPNTRPHSDPDSDAPTSDLQKLPYRVSPRASRLLPSHFPLLIPHHSPLAYLATALSRTTHRAHTSTHTHQSSSLAAAELERVAAGRALPLFEPHARALQPPTQMMMSAASGSGSGQASEVESTDEAEWRAVCWWFFSVGCVSR